MFAAAGAGKRCQHIVNIYSSSIQHVSCLKGGKLFFNIAVQQNRTDVEANLDCDDAGKQIGKIRSRTREPPIANSESRRATELGPFQLESAICESVNRLFWKADLFTCFQSNKKQYE